MPAEGSCTSQSGVVDQIWAEAGLDTGLVKTVNLYLDSSHRSTEAKTQKSHGREAMHSKTRGAVKCMFSSPLFFPFFYAFDHF